MDDKKYKMPSQVSNNDTNNHNYTFLSFARSISMYLLLIPLMIFFVLFFSLKFYRLRNVRFIFHKVSGFLKSFRVFSKVFGFFSKVFGFSQKFSGFLKSFRVFSKVFGVSQKFSGFLKVFGFSQKSSVY
jgi:hypothetical protein